MAAKPGSYSELVAYKSVVPCSFAGPRKSVHPAISWSCTMAASSPFGTKAWVVEDPSFLGWIETAKSLSAERACSGHCAFSTSILNSTSGLYG